MDNLGIFYINVLRYFGLIALCVISVIGHASSENYPQLMIENRTSTNVGLCVELKLEKNGKVFYDTVPLESGNYFYKVELFNELALDSFGVRKIENLFIDEFTKNVGSFINQEPLEYKLHIDSTWENGIDATFYSLFNIYRENESQVYFMYTIFRDNENKLIISLPDFTYKSKRLSPRYIETEFAVYYVQDTVTMTVIPIFLFEEYCEAYWGQGFKRFAPKFSVDKLGSLISPPNYMTGNEKIIFFSFRDPTLMRCVQLSDLFEGMSDSEMHQLRYEISSQDDVLKVYLHETVVYTKNF